MVGEALGRLRKMTRVRSHLGEDMPAEDLRDSAASCGEEETMNTKQSAICSTKSAPRRASPHRAAARDRRLSFESQPEEATSADTAATGIDRSRAARRA